MKKSIISIILSAAMVTTGLFFSPSVMAMTPEAGLAQENADNPSEDEYTAYLFASFTGSEGNNMDEQIYFAVSEDGYNYMDLNNGKPVLISDIGEKGVRDPYILRSADGDHFYLIATDLSIYYRGGWGRANATVTGSHNLVIWESDDLVNWSDPRLIEVASPDAGCAWAPEAIYNEKTGEYVIYFAESVLVNGRVNGNMCIYCVTTEDFETFSDAERFIVSPGRDIIDTSILKADDGYYYRASKDGANGDRTGSIRVDKCDDIFGEWETITSLSKLGFSRDMNNTSLEGPELFMFNKRDWRNGVPTYGVYTDRYMEGTGYLPLVTTDFNDIDNSGRSWDLLADGTFFFDNLKKRHGTIMNLTQEEYERILEKYGNNEAAKRDEQVKNSSLFRCDFEGNIPGDLKLNGSASVVYDNDKKSNVLSLDGSTGTFAELPTGFFDGRNSFTVTMDVKTEDVSGNYFTFALGLDNNRYMYYKAADTSRLSVAKNGSRYEQTVSGATSLLNKWVNVTITCDENATGMCKMKLFVDGVKLGEKNTYMKPTAFGNNLLSYFGRSFYTNDKYFKGCYDNIIIYNQALSEAEVADYVKNGEIVDYDIEITSKALDIKDTVFDRAAKTITVYADWKSLAGDLSKCDASIKVSEPYKLASAADVTYGPADSFVIKVASSDGRETSWTVKTVIGNNPIPPEAPANNGGQNAQTPNAGNTNVSDKGTSTIAGIAIDVPGNITIGVGEKVLVSLPSRGNTLKNDNPLVVSVESGGYIKGLKTGKAIITVSNPGTQIDVEVTVKKAPSKITVTPKKKTLKKGKKYKLDFKVKLPKNTACYNIKCRSSKKSVVSIIGQTGVTKTLSVNVKAKKKGKAVLTFSTFNKKKAKVKITVK